MERLLVEVERLMAGQPASVRFDSRDWLNQWLSTPCPGLGGEQPKAWLDTPERLSVVERLIGRMDGHSVA